MTRAYIAHNGEPHDCAVLVLASNVKEAKRLAWHSIVAEVCDSFLDLRVEWLRSADVTAITTKYDAPGVHEPDVCAQCHLWSTGLIATGQCDLCGGEEACLAPRCL